MFNKDFLKAVLADQKRLLKLSELRTVNVPKFDELSVKNIFPLIRQDAEVMLYFPDSYPNVRNLTAHTSLMFSTIWLINSFPFEYWYKKWSKFYVFVVIKSLFLNIFLSHIISGVKYFIQILTAIIDWTKWSRCFLNWLCMSQQWIWHEINLSTIIAN